MFKFLKSALHFFSDLGYYAKMEQYIKDKNPKSHAELERIIRDYYSIRGM
jgi:hypothetical protein